MRRRATIAAIAALTAAGLTQAVNEGPQPPEPDTLAAIVTRLKSERPSECIQASRALRDLGAAAEERKGQVFCEATVSRSWSQL